MTRILVTGGTGLTGQFVVAELVRRGYAVRVLCRPESAARVAGAEVALGDLGDPDSVARAARGADGIVHAACTYGDSAVDVAAMRALLASRGGGPFVFVSSLDVYGFAPGAIDEDTPLDETFNDYARGKVVCERLLRESGRRDHVALRAPYIFGPHPTARRRLVTKRLEEGRPIILPGRDAAEWSRYRDAWIDVRDLTAIIAACLERPPGGPLNVLAGHFVWHDLYEELIRLTGSASALVHKPLADITEEELARRELYAQTWRFSAERLARHLGTVPGRPLEVSLRETVTQATWPA